MGSSSLFRLQLPQYMMAMHYFQLQPEKPLPRWILIGHLLDLNCLFQSRSESGDKDLFLPLTRQYGFVVYVLRSVSCSGRRRRSPAPRPRRRTAGRRRTRSAARERRPGPRRRHVAERRGQDGHEGDAEQGGRARHGFSISRKAASSIAFTPSALALSSLEPASRPATTTEVFFETEEVTRRPAALDGRLRLVAGHRVEGAGEDELHPLEGGGAKGGLALLDPEALSLSRSTSRRFAGSRNHWWTDSATAGPIS